MRITTGFSLFAILFCSADVTRTAKADPEGFKDIVTEKPYAPYPTSSKWNVESHYENITFGDNAARVGSSSSRADWYTDGEDGEYWIVEIYGLLLDNDAYERYLERVWFQEEKRYARRCEIAMKRAVQKSRAFNEDAPGFEMYAFWYYLSGCTGMGDYKYCTGQYAALGPDAPSKLVKAHKDVLEDGSYNAELVELGIDAAQFGMECCEFDEGEGGSGNSCKKLDKKCVDGQREKCKEWLEVECLNCYDYNNKNKHKKCIKKTGQIYHLAKGYDYVCDNEVINT